MNCRPTRNRRRRISHSLSLTHSLTYSLDHLITYSLSSCTNYQTTRRTRLQLSHVLVAAILIFPSFIFFCSQPLCSCSSSVMALALSLSVVVRPDGGAPKQPKPTTTTHQDSNQTNLSSTSTTSESTFTYPMVRFMNQSINRSSFGDCIHPSVCQSIGAYFSSASIPFDSFPPLPSSERPTS